MAAEASFSAAFSAGRQQLLAELGEDPSPEHVVALVRQRLDELPERYARAAGWPPRGSGFRRLRLLVSAVGTSCAGALLGASAQVDQTVPPATRFPWAQAKFVRGKLPLPAPIATVMIDPVQVVDKLQEALAELDRYLMDEGVRFARRAPQPWRADRELIQLFQDLLAVRAGRSHDDLLARLTRLAKDLRLQHGISVVDFEPANPRHDAAMFDLPAGLTADRTNGVTLKPALLVVVDAAGQPVPPRVLLRGEVGVAFPTERTS